MDSANLRAYVAETVGTFALVFLGAATVCAAKIPAGGQPEPTLLGIALAEGLFLGVLLSVTTHVSEGYLNPAVTLMFWVLKRLDGRRAAGLIAAQLIGAAAAGFLISVSFDPSVLAEANLGTPYLKAFRADGFVTFGSLLSGIGVEVVLTFILTVAIFATSVDPRAPNLGGLGAGLTLTAVVLVGFHLTGPCVNPARWLGTVIWHPTIPQVNNHLPGGPFADHAVFWIGPVVGALLGGAFYTLFVLRPEEEQQARARLAARSGALAKK